MARPDGPDFLCVGLQKGGTRWLYDQLKRHPDFWMPPIKELHYLNQPFPGAIVERAVARFRARRKKHRGEHRKRDRTFIEFVASTKGTPSDLETYALMFRPKRRFLTGDVTPAYSTLDAGMIAALAARFQATKAVLLLRDPVERAWSHWRMEIDRERFPRDAIQDVSALAGFLDRADVAARSYPSRIATRWREGFDERFRYFFLDDVARRPEVVRQEVISFLGADSEKPSIAEAGFNRKASTPTPRSEDVRSLMRERFREERERCAALFGGPAASWPDAPY